MYCQKLESLGYIFTEDNMGLNSSTVIGPHSHQILGYLEETSKFSFICY